MKRRTMIRLFSIGIGTLLVLGGLLWKSRMERDALRRQVEAGYARSFAALSSDVSQLHTALQKCACSSSCALTGEACGEIWAKSQSAQENLGELPFSEWLLEKTAGFLGRVGDYAQTMTLRCSQGGLSAAERETLAQLESAAGELSQQILNLEARLEDGSISMTAAEKALEPGVELLGEQMVALEDSFPELPTLIYDGPYSESAVLGPARMLEGLEAVTEEQALQAAADFTGLSAENFSVIGRSQNALNCYLLSTADGMTTLRVTKQGGLVVDLVMNLSAGEERLSPEEGVQLAEDFLRAKGYRNMRRSYWTRENGSVLVNFAWEQDGVICYPDLVKVRVDLTGGQVIGYEAAGYLMNHHPRSIPVPVPEETGRQAVWKELTILSSALALIPTGDKQERCCWEYQCETPAGNHCIVYTDARTGEEVKILLLLEDENGTLTV